MCHGITYGVPERELNPAAGLITHFVVGADVRAGRLVRILRDFSPRAADIHVVYASRRHLSAKVRAFTDFLVQRFTAADWALEGAAPAGGRRKPARR